MIRVLIFVDWYLPGYKAGGPVRTVSNLIELLGTDLQFFVMTRDTDLGETTPYPDVPANLWTTVGKAQVLYTSDLSLANLRNRINEVRPDIIYLNSFFSRFTIRFLLLRQFKLLPKRPVVLAPRGEFSGAALGIKKWRKRAFMTAAFRLLYRNILWQGSSEPEAAQIASALKKFGGRRMTEVLLARNAQGPNALQEGETNRSSSQLMAKEPGKVKFVFLSRISRMKNLKYAIEACCRLEGEVIFDIYGPIEDPGLWSECQQLFQKAPANIKVNFRGPVPPNRVLETFARYHFFVFPTLGENFGHVILEALSAGCPVVTSNRTPWRQLEQAGVGWDLPLEDQSSWLKALHLCVAMDDSRYALMRSQASRFAQRLHESPETREENLNLFRRALSMGQPNTDEARAAGGGA